MTRPARAAVLKTALVVLCTLAALAFLVMLPLGYVRYTSVGLDTDRQDARGGIWHAFYRIQWPGDGTFRVGGSGFYEVHTTHALEPFDLGGRILLPRTIAPVPPPNHLGFSTTYFERADAWGRFVGIPAWLPILPLATPLLLRRRHRRRSSVEE